MDGKTQQAPLCRTVEHDQADMVALAQRKLQSHPQFHWHCQTIHIDLEGELLVLTGQLPSFYLKQLAQEALRGITPTVINRIDVVSCDGLSSTRQ
ncbi:MAG: hypothetical protein KDA92_11770 [Planctomycetales bacterium]|nr:hypothetical protein [Planctomycetales bacterium]